MRLSRAVLLATVLAAIQGAWGDDSLPPDAVARLDGTRYRTGPAGLATARSADGRMIAVGGGPLFRSGPSSYRVVDTTDGSLVARLEATEWCALSPDGALVATWSQWEASVHVAETRTGRPIRSVSADGIVVGVARTVTFSPDARRLVTADLAPVEGSSAPLEVWSVATGARQRAIAGGLGPVFFSADGARLTFSAWGKSGFEVVVWDLAAGQETKRVAVAGKPIALSTDGRRVALLRSGPRPVVSADDLETGKTLAQVGVDEAPTSVVFSPDGSVLGVGRARRDGPLVHFLDLATGTKKEFGGPWSAVSIGPDAKTFLGLPLGTEPAVVIDASTGAPVDPAPAAGPVVGLAFTPDGKTLAVAREAPAAPELLLCDAATAKVTRRLALPGPVCGELTFAPDGRSFAFASDLVEPKDHAGGRGHLLRVVALDGGKELFAPIPVYALRVPPVAFSADGSELATGGSALVVRNAATGALIVSLRETAFGLAFLEDGRLVFGHTEEEDPEAAQRVSILPADRRSPRTELGGVRAVFAGGLVATPDARWVAVAERLEGARPSANGFVLGGATSGWRKIEGLSAPLAISPDGRWLVGVRAERAVVLETATGRVAKTLAGHDAPVTRVAFSRDGKRLATASADGSVIVRDTARLP